MINGQSVIIAVLADSLLLMTVLAVKGWLTVRSLRPRCRNCRTPMLAEHYCPKCERELLDWMRTNA